MYIGYVGSNSEKSVDARIVTKITCRLLFHTLSVRPDSRVASPYIENTDKKQQRYTMVSYRKSLLRGPSLHNKSKIDRLGTKPVLSSNTCM